MSTSTVWRSQSALLPPSAKHADRIDNLDLVRALAIAVVVVYHATMEMRVSDFAHLLSSAGQYGVDLFFVLSGYLIGGLYWKEHREFGDVSRARFIARRALRTMPPYFVALALSYLAVRVARQEPFDVGYLIFAQNYYLKVPFFFASWSLCIEEHFYLTLPLLLGAVISRSRRLAPVFLIMAWLVSLACRVASVDASPFEQPFGYYLTATHLRLDGLALGVLASYCALHAPAIFVRAAKWRTAIFVVAATVPLSLPWITPWARYVLGYALLALAFMFLVGVGASQPGWTLSRLRITRLVAGTSYSIYLTHVLVIHAIAAVLGQRLQLNQLLVWMIMIVASLAVGYVFHRAVERPAILLRDKLVQRRRASANINVEPIVPVPS